MTNRVSTRRHGEMSTDYPTEVTLQCLDDSADPVASLCVVLATEDSDAGLRKRLSADVGSAQYAQNMVSPRPYSLLYFPNPITLRGKKMVDGLWLADECIVVSDQLCSDCTINGY